LNFTRAGQFLGAAVLAVSLGLVKSRGAAVMPAAPAASGPKPTLAPAPGRTARRLDLLADQLDQASFIVPRLQAGLRTFHAVHWRAMTAPYSRVEGARRQALQVVALTLGEEKMLSSEHKMGLGSAAELRTWNTAEASFDVREAILAPPPSTMLFPMRLPAGATLEVAPTALGLRAGSLTFEVAVRPRGKERQLVDTLKIAARDAPAWRERRIDLSAFAGQQVEIELTVKGGPAELERTPAALWGAPAVVSEGSMEVPYNVLWFVIDTMRPDPLPAWHPPEREAALDRAKVAPLEAWLPAIPELTPAINRLASGGVSFVEASSAATWTRPGTLSMLAGARSSQLGLDTTPWVLPSTTVARFYASSPPLLPLLLRRHGVRTQALVNNFFLTGYARAGIDPGFLGMVDHRHETLDTQRITGDALAWLEKHQQERFFLFVNLNSPHGPYTPPDRCLARVPKATIKNDTVRRYVAEFCKDDEAVGKILAKLGELKLEDRTLVVLTADHGETLSRDHDVLMKGLDPKAGSTRFHHASAMYEETARVPLILSLPGKLPAGERRFTPAQTTDIVPTILELQGLPVPEKVRGKSLLAWARGAPPQLDRPVVTEGRASRSIRVGRYRYVEHDDLAQQRVHAKHGVLAVKEELYDLEEDPGERRNIAEERKDDVRRLQELLAEALATSTAQDVRQSAALAGSRHQSQDTSPPARLRLRFSGGSQARRWTIAGRLADPEPGAPEPRLKVTVFQEDPGAAHVDGRVFDGTLRSHPGALVGLDLEVSPSSTPIQWSIQVDEQALRPEQIFGGTFGLKAPMLLEGLQGAEARLMATAEGTPLIDARREVGVFVLRDPSADVGVSLSSGGEALGEVQQLLSNWGYAADPGKR
jgi:arylsulfatase A-like enzyme